MCKNIIAKTRAIEKAKRLSPEVVKVYEVGYDLVPNLLNLIVVHDQTSADVYEVDSRGNIEKVNDRSIIWDEPSFPKICELTGLDPHFAKVEDWA